MHLGGRNPQHLWPNLKRHLREFPEVPVTLVLDERRLAKRAPSGVEVMFHPRNSPALPSQRAAPSSEFRGGFWRLTLERLLALETAHRVHSDERLIHIESDVLLLPSFPWEKLAHQSSMMWGGATANLDIAAILYTPSLEHTLHLTGYIRRRVLENPAITDMRVLNEYYVENQETTVRRLPFSFDGKGFEGGFFDVMSIGQWLTGLDPSNAVGVRRYHVPMPHHLVNPSTLSYEIQGGSLKAIRGSQIKEIFSLHIHSKDVNLFRPRWKQRLADLVALAQKNPSPVARFSVPGLIRWAREFLREITSKRFAMAVIGKFLTSIKK